MLSIGALSFTAPVVLAALLALPAIWWLLRVTPPSPRRVRFPALRLLLGLKEEEETPAHMPPWLLALRLLLAALVILALAGPLWNAARGGARGEAEVIVIDNGWAAAAAWKAREEALRVLIEAAERRGGVLAIVETAPGSPQEPVFTPAARLARKLPALAPRPWDPRRLAALETARKLKAQAPGKNISVTWLSDGFDYGAAKKFAEGLKKLGNVQVRMQSGEDLPLALRPVTVADGVLKATAIRAGTGKPAARRGTARALDEKGSVVGLTEFAFDEGARETAVTFDLPLELRNRIVQIRLADMDSAGAVTLIDESARRRPVGLVSGGGSDAEQPLLSETYYLRRALKPYTDIREGTVSELIGSGLSLLVLADVGQIVGEDFDTVKRWVESGGVLLRFAGPRLARQSDDLVPVRLRRGGRALGGALSWETPQKLAPFDPESPFAGLELPEDVTVSRQVLAEPTVDLSEKTWARLEDGTPLVTAARRGEGWLVLVHVTANTDWSNLPLSGLYVQMLRRISGLGQAVHADELQHRGDGSAIVQLPPRLVLDGFGRLVSPPPTVSPLILGEEEPQAGPRTPPGLYGHGNAEQALNLIGPQRQLTALTRLPSGVSVSRYSGMRELGLKAPLLTLAFLLALADGVIALAISGRLRGLEGVFPAARGAGVAIVLIGASALLLVPDPVRAAAQDDKHIMDSTLETRLGYVKTGVADTDNLSRAGLAGLSRILFERTAVEPGPPAAVDVENDELAVFPLLYWRVTPEQEPPSSAALKRIDRFLKNGGMILFDTADQHESMPGTVHQSANQRALRSILDKLDVPPLVQVPPDHVLTKAFYILRNRPDEWFPGRWTGGDVWVEAARGGEEGVSNDGVTSIIIGSNDWAGAWAMDAAGRAVAAVVPGGRRQREFAYRFGVNLVMYTLTGNYKADQVHVPAILERLGQ